MNGFNGASDLGPAIEIGIAQDAVVVGAGEGIGIGADDARAEFELFLLSVDGADLCAVGKAELAKLIAPGVAGIGRDIFGGQKANADGFQISGLSHFPTELREFVFRNVGGPLNRLNKPSAAHFEIDDFANAFFDGGVIM